jgi:hypothetical protein
MNYYAKLAEHIGHECIEHPAHGKYTLDGFYSKGVLVTRNLTGHKEDEEYEMFGFDEVMILYQGKTTEFDTIEQAICSAICTDPITLSSRSRKREFVEARQVCHYIAKKMSLGSLGQIGKRFGKVDHATVIHSCRTVDALLSSDKIFKEQYKPIIDQFCDVNKTTYQAAFSL